MQHNDACTAELAAVFTRFELTMSDIEAPEILTYVIAVAAAGDG